jgi:hypothetical protein
MHATQRLPIVIRGTLVFQGQTQMTRVDGVRLGFMAHVGMRVKSIPFWNIGFSMPAFQVRGYPSSTL